MFGSKYIWLVLGIIFFSLAFQNCGAPVGLTHMEDSVVQTSSVSFSNNNQNLAQKAFGSSPQSTDGRSIYNFDEANQKMVKEAMWSNLRTEFDSIYLHTMLLVDNNDHYNGFPSDSLAAQVALNQNQLRGLRYLQEEKGFKIIVDTGLGLGVGCGERRPWKFAENAVDRDYAYIQRLHDAGINVNEVSVDGPFLRVVEGSEKAFSCQTYYDNGFSPAKAAEIVSRYLAKLRRQIRSNQTFNPKINIVLNYPNHKVGELHGFHDVDLEEIMEHFVPRLEYPKINRVILDYPYNLVEGASSVFRQKILALDDLFIDLRGGAPHLGIIINSGGHFGGLPTANNAKTTMNTQLVEDYYYEAGNIDGYIWGKQCLHRGNQAPFILFYESNLCLAGLYGIDKKNIALQYIEAERKHFTNNTLEYYRLVKKHLPASVRVDSVYFASWYEFPMRMTSYASNSVNTVKIVR